jgi:hypothetical protein
MRVERFSKTLDRWVLLQVVEDWLAAQEFLSKWREHYLVRPGVALVSTSRLRVVDTRGKAHE